MSRESSTLPYVVQFEDPEARDIALVGGKAVNLARLVQAEFPVPGGFVVTSTAYHAVIDGTGISELVGRLADLDTDDTDAVAKAGAELRDRIQELSFPDEVRSAITDAYTVAGARKSYAARSSATAEDLPEASFAGQHETVLNVQGEDEILKAVRTCMASLFTDRAIVYRARNDIPHDEVTLAVVVQEMLDPDGRIHMSEAWIQLRCPACEEHWEENPVDLPSPDEEFQCRHCGARNPVSAFMRAKRDLEILEEFHSE